MPPNLQSRRPTFAALSRAAFWIRLHIAVAPMLLVALSLCDAAQSVTLAWNASPSSGVSGYKVYYGTSSGSPGPPTDVGNVTSATISNLNDATLYFFSVTAYYDPSGPESSRSNEVFYKTPAQQEILYFLTVNFGTGSGPYPYAAEVRVTASPQPGEEFAYWDDDRDILANFMSADTTARILRMEDLTITAIYKYTVTVTNGTGDGSYFADDPVQIVADAAPAGQQFTGWTATGNVTLADAASPTTTFKMPSSPLTVTANYKVSDKIRYYPRSGHRLRMVGGVFEGTNDPASGYNELHTISANPPLAWTTVNVNLRGYKYLRYRGPNGSYGNVAEIEFYRDGAKIQGTGFGTPGSFRNRGATFQKALDANTSTFFDGPTANGNYVGVITQ
jgi:Fibronectin type III domain/Divergent InlB B-repeat domain